MKKSFVNAIVILALTPLLATSARATESGEQNLLFSITVVDVGADGETAERSTKVLALSGTRADLSTGWKVPIPTSTARVEGADDPVTSFSYQDIGFLAWIDGRITGQGGVHASGRIEVSSVEPAGDSVAGHIAAPTIASFSQKFDVVLRDGIEMTLAEAPRPDGGSRSLTISVTIER
jgi:hypothetical protein